MMIARLSQATRGRTVCRMLVKAALGVPGAAGVSVLTGIPVAAHSEVRPTPETVWHAWEFDPLTAIGLLLASWLYLRGTAELWRRAGKGRGVRQWQVIAFFGGVATVAFARFSPLDAMGGALFSAHMVQHLLLYVVSPVLFAASRPLLPLMWAVPLGWRRRLIQWVSVPAPSVAWRSASHWFAALLLYGLVLWLWHLPALYNAALESQLVHGVEHWSFLVAGFMFWSRLFDAGRPNNIGYGIAFLMTFVTALQSGALGALLTFADMPLYSTHEEYTAAWGVTPLEDQQLAGVLMWVPMGLWLAASGLVVFALWLRSAERSVRQWESEESDIMPSRIGEAAET